MFHSPDDPATVPCATPVPGFAARTVAPGNTPPLESVMTPLTEPVALLCPAAAAAPPNSVRAITIHRRALTRIAISSFVVVDLVVMARSSRPLRLKLPGLHHRDVTVRFPGC